MTNNLDIMFLDNVSNINIFCQYLFVKLLFNRLGEEIGLK